MLFSNRPAEDPFSLTGQPEVDAPVLVGLTGGGNIQFCNGDLASALVREYPQSLSRNRVVPDLFAVSIAKHQHRFGADLRRRRVWRRVCRHALGTQARNFVIQAVNLLPLLVGNGRARVVGRRVGILGIRLGWIRVRRVRPDEARAAIPSQARRVSVIATVAPPRITTSEIRVMARIVG